MCILHMLLCHCVFINMFYAPTNPLLYKQIRKHLLNASLICKLHGNPLRKSIKEVRAYTYNRTVYSYS